MKRFLKKAFS